MDRGDLELVHYHNEAIKAQALFGNDAKAKAALAAYKARKRKAYGSALLPAMLIGACILVTCVAIWGGWL